MSVHLDEKGRGRALRRAWSQSDGDVVAYMDVDLSTDLDAFLPLVAPLVSGHSDVAIGSRLAPGAAVARGPEARGDLARVQPDAAGAVRHPGARHAVWLQGGPPRRRDAHCSRRSRTTAGSSTPSCCCWRSATAFASTRSPSTGPTIPTAACTSPRPPRTTSAAWFGSRSSFARGRGRIDVPRATRRARRRPRSPARHLRDHRRRQHRRDDRDLPAHAATRLGAVAANTLALDRRVPREHVAQRSLQLPRRATALASRSR